MRITSAIVAVALAAGMATGVATAKTTGGGSTIAAQVPVLGLNAPVISTTGTIYRNGAVRYAASYSYALYRMGPRETRGRLMKSSAGQVNGSPLWIPFFQNCVPTRVSYRWFAVLKVYSQKTARSPVVQLRAQSDTARIKCF